MTKKNIEISLMKESEIEAVISFYNDLYKDNRTKEKFVWEFFHTPAGQAIYVIAKDSETQQIIGTQCAIPIELITHTGNTILTAKSEDTLVDPNYRGLNIFDNMYQLLFEKCRERGIKYLWGFTSAKKPFLKLGFEIPFGHSQSTMVMNIAAAYKYLASLNPKNNFLAQFKIMGLCIASKMLTIKRLFISSKVANAKYNYSESGKKIQENAHIPHLSTSYKGFSIKADLPFLRWRIENNPYHTQIFNVYFYQNSEIVANLIFNHHKNGVWYLILDTYAASLSVDEKKIILNRTIDLLQEKENNTLSLIRTWDFSHNEYGKSEIGLREKVGFVHLERGISFVWKSLDDANKLNVSDFNLSRIASQGMV